MKKLDRAFAGMGRRRLARPRSLALLLGVLGAALVWSGPALALSQRGHVFSFSFGKTTPAEGGSLLHPAAVAVNESSGDVYVVDAANNRVERFNAKGEFQEAWGWGVSNGEAKYQQCVKTGCKPGLAGTEPAQFSEPDAIAVDNSTNPADPSKGDVYVASQPNVVEKFSSTGTYLGRLKTETSIVGGVAVDSNGVVWVYDFGTGNIVSFNDALINEAGSTIHAEVQCLVAGFTVGSTAETFYVDHQKEVFEKNQGPLCPATLPSNKAPAVTAKLNAKGQPLSEGLDNENTSAVAVDLASAEGSPLGKAATGDVYLDNITSIAEFDSSGSLIQRFGSEPGAELQKGSGVAVNAKTGAVYVADKGKNRVDVFAPAPPGAPEVNSVSTQNLTPTETELRAQIDPRGQQTEYVFQYGTENCAVNEAACTSTAAKTIEAGYGDQLVSVVLQNLKSGAKYYFRVVAHNASGQATGELAKTFTTLPNPAGVLADSRAWEMVSPPEKDGASVNPLGFGLEAPLGGIVQASKDGQSITYVATAPIEPEAEANRAPEGIQVMSTRSSSPPSWSSKDIITKRKQAEGLVVGVAQEYQFFSPNLEFALVQTQPAGGNNPLQEPPLVSGLSTEERSIYRRHDATCPTTPATCYEPLVSPENDTAKAPYGDQLEFLSATPDLGHAVFRSAVSLTSLAPPEEGQGLYEWTAGSHPSEPLQPVSVRPGTEQFAPRAELGDDKQGVSSSDRNAISANGSRVFWSESSEVTGTRDRLYMRDTAKGFTIQINATEAGVKEPKGEQLEKTDEVHFQTANSEGTKVFFTDTLKLTNESQLRAEEAGPADLYVCELPPESEITATSKCTLKDLTVDPHSNLGESAEVVGEVIGAGENTENRSSVYFVANGALAEGATHGSCLRHTATGVHSPPGATCNLYVDRFISGKWEPPKLIAILSGEDSPDWGSLEHLWALSSRVSPNGRYLAFMSQEPLTGYENTDASPAAKGARDEEVFRYDAEAEALTCASCNPNPAQRPTGVFDTPHAGEGSGLVVDPLADVWEGHWLAGSIPGWTALSPIFAPYQSRYLLDNGRLFFNSADALVPADVNHRQEVIGSETAQVGVEDVYQFEPEGLGSCTQTAGCVSLISSGTSEHESAFLDASESGNDVFFLTSAQLVPADRDTNYDVYDARACAQASECVQPAVPPPSPCSGEATCRAPAPSPPGFGASGSSTFSGPGNTAKQETLHEKVNVKPKPQARSQKLAKALKSCRKKYKHSKKKRVACEKQARKHYAKKAAHRRGGRR